MSSSAFMGTFWGASSAFRAAFWGASSAFWGASSALGSGAGASSSDDWKNKHKLISSHEIFFKEAKPLPTVSKQTVDSGEKQYHDRLKCTHRQEEIYTREKPFEWHTQTITIFLKKHATEHIQTIVLKGSQQHSHTHLWLTTWSRAWGPSCWCWSQSSWDVEGPYLQCLVLVQILKEKCTAWRVKTGSDKLKRRGENDFPTVRKF